MRKLRIRRAGLLTGVVALLFAAGAYAAVIPLPAFNTQVNNDPAVGIDPQQDAGASDIVGGSLVAGGPRVPWATFEQMSDSSQQIFVRAFKDGQWVTQGRSLNISPDVEAEEPSIDFAGAGRNVPWDSWYEPNAALGGAKQIFASRFIAATNTWVPEGQDRGSGVPSLNIHTDKEAENPSVAGGAAVPGNDPVPWIAWQEQDGSVSGSGNHDQIFVSKGVKQANAKSPCTGLEPSTANTVSMFCWQQVGLDRLDPSGGSSAAGDPTLNVDPSRNGIEPDIAFTGANDKVAWVVWYETDSSSLGLRDNEQVFAAKIVADTAADGGFHWQAVGRGTVGQTNVLDTSSTGFGPCAASASAEDACSLNLIPSRDAEDPRVAAGTLTPGTPTVPWVVWAEDIGNGRHGVFVARLVGGDHFELFNGGKPVSDIHRDAVRPDITFFGNVPYVSWIEPKGSVNRGFVGHFANGVFSLDTSRAIRFTTRLRSAPVIDARVPLSSSCTSDPFTNDGAACPLAAVNAPFDLFTTTESPQRLFSQAIVGGPNCVLFPGCALSVDQQGGAAVLSSALGQSDNVGILVQRIVGIRHVHGKRVLVTRTVGRVPLGHHPRGSLKIRWNLKVGGHRLRPGKYLITLRALDRHRNVLGYANPAVVKISAS
jgi:hypothetical protein